MTDLHVYVMDECWACDEARRIVAQIGPLFPDANVELRDLNDSRRPDAVFAAPSYVLDGRIAFLGNPTEGELAARLEVAGRQRRKG
jgi:hypothetical protein